ncbi:hypothetical protein GXW82_18165 [Streptacidiphilus sp. 4-A2]|nr:hypothetical protein [Streptacidiphilus sp. 4-A2]
MTLAVAHRGDPLLFRENTMPSLASAVAGGADWVEVDVKLTRDGVPVLLHDDTLLRLWQHDRRVDALTWAELTRLTGGGIPALREALEFARDSRVPLMVDLPARPRARPRWSWCAPWTASTGRCSPGSRRRWRGSASRSRRR